MAPVFWKTELENMVQESNDQANGSTSNGAGPGFNATSYLESLVERQGSQVSDVRPFARSAQAVQETKYVINVQNNTQNIDPQSVAGAFGPARDPETTAAAAFGAASGVAAAAEITQDSERNERQPSPQQRFNT